MNRENLEKAKEVIKELRTSQAANGLMKRATVVAVMLGFLKSSSGIAATSDDASKMKNDLQIVPVSWLGGWWHPWNNWGDWKNWQDWSNWNDWKNWNNWNDWHDWNDWKDWKNWNNWNDWKDWKNY